MADPVRIVGLGGSLDGSSSSLAALNIAMEAARACGAETQVLDLHAVGLPLFEPGLAGSPVVRRFVETMYSADGLLWSSPLYHGSVSGAFKNALDWLELLSKREPPYLTDKVVGLIATAGGVQGMQAINTMEFVVRSLRGWTVPLTVPVARAWHAFDNDGRAVDEKVEHQLQTLGREVARAAALFHGKTITTREASEVAAELDPLTEEEARKG